MVAAEAPIEVTIDTKHQKLRDEETFFLNTSSQVTQFSTDLALKNLQNGIPGNPDIGLQANKMLSQPEIKFLEQREQNARNGIGKILQTIIPKFGVDQNKISKGFRVSLSTSNDIYTWVDPQTGKLKNFSNDAGKSFGGQIDLEWPIRSFSIVGNGYTNYNEVTKLSSRVDQLEFIYKQLFHLQSELELQYVAKMTLYGNYGGKKVQNYVHEGVGVGEDNSVYTGENGVMIGGGMHMEYSPYEYEKRFGDETKLSLKTPITLDASVALGGVGGKFAAEGNVNVSISPQIVVSKGKMNIATGVTGTASVYKSGGNIPYPVQSSTKEFAMSGGGFVKTQIGPVGVDMMMGIGGSDMGINSPERKRTYVKPGFFRAKITYNF